MKKGNNLPVIDGTQKSVDDAVLWSAWTLLFDKKKPSVCLSLTQREALRREKFTEMHRISKLELAIDEIAQEYKVDMRRYKYLRLKEKS